MDSRNAFAKIIRRIEDCSVGVGQLLRKCKQAVKFVLTPTLDAFQMAYRGFCPDRPLPKQAAGEANSRAAEMKFSHQIEQDVVVIAGVQGNFLRAT